MNSLEKEQRVTVSLAELDLLIRRAVREVLRDELSELLNAQSPRVIDDWRHEGEDDAAADEALLVEALQLLKRRAESREGWQSWQAFKQSIG